MTRNYRHAEDLVEQEKIAAALPILERVRDNTRRPERRRALEGRIDEIRKALDFNHFIDEYNHAVGLANQGDVEGAAAILEPLAKAAGDPTQAEQARNLLAKLKPSGQAARRRRDTLRPDGKLAHFLASPAMTSLH